MEKEYNTQQANYLLARTLLAAVEDREREVEQKYIADNSIVNGDGTTPERIYCIEDMDTFNKANAECSDVITRRGLWAEIVEARRMLKKAEELLVDYAIAIAPHTDRAAIAEVAKNYTARQKIIALTMRLDTSTVAQGGRQ